MLLASNVSEPGQATPQLLETIRKAGVKNLLSKAEDESRPIPASENNRQALLESESNATRVSSGPTRAKESNSSRAKASEGKRPRNNKKSVSFTADTKTESLLEHKSKTKIPILKPVDPASSEDKFPKAETPHRQPVIPANESSDDAALRRQMIEYNMSEVNNIVAEINLDDEASDASYSDADSEDIPDDSSLDEDEDKFGRAKRRVLSDDYLAEMRALEQRLNAKAIRNVGPNEPTAASILVNGHETEEQAPNGSPGKDTNKELKPSPTKAVRFASELDIQSSPPPSTSPRPQSPTPSQQRPIHANQIIERPYATTSSTTPTEPDEFDPALLQQEVKTEYHKVRNRMIQRQGGFTDPDEGPEIPLTEAEGGPKKMSRFKAARLGRGTG